MKTIMTIIVFVTVMMTSSLVQAREDYTGVWQITNTGNFLVSVHEKNGITAIFTLDNSYGGFDTAIGSRIGNRVVTQSLDEYSFLRTKYEVTFTSPTTFRAKQLSCISIYSGWNCAYPNGYIFTGKKLL